VQHSRRLPSRQKIIAEQKAQGESRALERFHTRDWKAGDVYAPHDLSPQEMKKWSKRQSPSKDAFDALNLNPLDHYKVCYASLGVDQGTAANTLVCIHRTSPSCPNTSHHWAASSTAAKRDCGQSTSARLPRRSGEREVWGSCPACTSTRRSCRAIRGVGVALMGFDLLMYYYLFIPCQHLFSNCTIYFPICRHL
jgi:hypothetical protein